METGSTSLKTEDTKNTSFWAFDKTFEDRFTIKIKPSAYFYVRKFKTYTDTGFTHVWLIDWRNSSGVSFIELVAKRSQLTRECNAASHSTATPYVRKAREKKAPVKDKIKKSCFCKLLNLFITSKARYSGNPFLLWRMLKITRHWQNSDQRDWNKFLSYTFFLIGQAELSELETALPEFKLYKLILLLQHMICFFYFHFS